MEIDLCSDRDHLRTGLGVVIVPVPATGLSNWNQTRPYQKLVKYFDQIETRSNDHHYSLSSKRIDILWNNIILKPPIKIANLLKYLWHRKKQVKSCVKGVNFLTKKYFILFHSLHPILRNFKEVVFNSNNRSNLLIVLT